jgi:hypothetical protein
MSKPAPDFAISWILPQEFLDTAWILLENVVRQKDWSDCLTIKFI